MKFPNEKAAAISQYRRAPKRASTRWASRARRVAVAVIALGAVVSGMRVQAAETSASKPPGVASPRILAPRPWATLAAPQVVLTVQTPAAPSRPVRVLLNGADVTAQFGNADATGKRSGRFAVPTIHHGRNQIQLRYGNALANSDFVYDRAGPDLRTAASGPNSAAASTQALLVPVKTRVLRPNADPNVGTNWGISVGDQVYYAPAPVDSNNNPCSGDACNTGLQFLLLSRRDLTPIPNGNVAFQSSSATDWAAEVDAGFPSALSAFVTQAAYSPISGCIPAGCILVVQSLARIGYTPCPMTDLQSCFAQPGEPSYTTIPTSLQATGATGSLFYANGASPKVAYSFIGNVGSGNQQTAPGAQQERLGCAMSSGCSGLTAFGPDGNSPANPQQIGAISGAFVRDNFFSYTFTPTAPQFNYEFGSFPISCGGSQVGVRSYISLNDAVEGQLGYYNRDVCTSLDAPPPTDPNMNYSGGFHLLVLDRSSPLAPRVATFEQVYPFAPDSEDQVNATLATLKNDIDSHAGANALIFLAGFGKVPHDLNPDLDDDSSLPFTAPAWSALAESVAAIGGDAITFNIYAECHPIFDPANGITDSSSGCSFPFGRAGTDDYLLVGHPGKSGNDVYAAMPSFFGREGGLVMRKKTMTNPAGVGQPWSPTVVEGVLKLDNFGYYEATGQANSQGVLSAQTTTIVGASLLPPSAWPYASDPAHVAAYQWISNQLCCADIRTSYVNLNASPALWLSDLERLTYPQQSAFGPSDFDDMVAQLANEFSYLILVRNLENNVLQLYTSQQANVGSILQEAADDVISDVYNEDQPPPVQPPAWRSLLEDAFPLASSFTTFIPGNEDGSNPAAAGLQAALGVGSFIVDQALQHTNDSYGNSQRSQELAAQSIAAADLAQTVVDQYTESLITFGNDFDRIVTDWGRLRTLGVPLANSQLPWDQAASGYFLRAFNLAARRAFYPALLSNSGDPNADFNVVHVMYMDFDYYGSDSHGSYLNSDGVQCQLSLIHDRLEDQPVPTNYKGIGWYPGVLKVAEGRKGMWWDSWGLVYKNGHDRQNICPNPDDVDGVGDFPSVFGMFDPVDPNDTASLGLWQPHLFQRSLGPINQRFNVQGLSDQGYWPENDVP